MTEHLTRRRIVFHNPASSLSWIVSETFVGDRTELENTSGSVSCDHTWEEFLDAMSAVDDLTGYLNALTYIWKSYHPSPGPYQGPRLSFLHSLQDLRAMASNERIDALYQITAGIPGAHLVVAEVA